jgi:hypothetical protein
MIIDFDKILLEWSYRVSDGIIRTRNIAHQLHLRQILFEFGWPQKVIDGVLHNLNEQEKDREKILKTRIKYKDDKGNDRETSVKSAYENPEHPAHQQAKDLLDTGKTKEPTTTVKGPDAKADRGKSHNTDINPDYKRDGGEEPEDTDTLYDQQEKNTVMKGADSEIKNLSIKYGYKTVKDKDGNVIFKPAPGNAGSMLNEIVSGEVANILEKNPDATEEEIIEILEKQLGDSKLFIQNKGSKPAGDLKVGDVPEGKNRGLHSKLIIAVRSGRRKHDKATRKAKQNNFENPKVQNYYGHSESFDAMVRDLQGKEVIGPDGTSISLEEAEELIRSGGGGDNPSDTATLVFDSESNKVIMLFHSDKDSTGAIIAQSSTKAEAEANEKNINKLVEDGKITEEQAEAIIGRNKELVEDLDKIEKELKPLMIAPAKHFLDNVSIKEALKSVLTDKDSDGNVDNNKTSTKFAGLKGKNGKVKKPINQYLDDNEDPTDEELLEAYLKFMADPNKPKEPTQPNLDLMERLNRRFVDQGAPNVDEQLEDIRNRTIQTQEDFMEEMDDIKMDVDDKEVGVGTFLEGNTAWNQFHLEATNPESKKGVHKYPGMFETNHAGLAVDGETLQGCLKGKVKNKNDFIKRLEVGETTAQKGRTGTQKGKTTGSKRIVYAITAEDERIEVGTKVARTKTGKLGKLQTVYQWSDDMKNCFSKKDKKD